MWTEDRLRSAVPAPGDSAATTVVGALPLMGQLPTTDDVVPPSAAVLLVDDRPENLVALRAVLEPLNERLVSAESGEQALRVLLREEIAVILLDVRMAGLDGLETARLIRSRRRTQHIPIIFLTAEASDVGEIARAYASGAVDYVIKPYAPEILRAKVSIFVDLHRERGERILQSRARAQAEAVIQTVRVLQAISDTALAHLELDGLTTEMVERCRTLFSADVAAVLLRDENATELRLTAMSGDALSVHEVEAVIVGEGILGQLAATRRPALLRAEAEQAVPYGAGDSDRPALSTLLVVPLEVSSELLGLLLVGARHERRLDNADLELLALAGDRLAIAIDHIVRFAEGRRLVETFQRRLLPDQLPVNPRIQLAARYLPAGVAPQVGGDWYDAVPLDNDRLAVMIGDVVGHGVRAATTMSDLRNALRAFAVEGHGPAQALHQLDRVAHATFGQRMIATALFLTIDPLGESVTLARAGHLPPALRGVDGSVRFLETDHTLPLGIDASVVAAEIHVPIAPGDTLLLFTDGLVERRHESLDVGLERLRHHFADAPAGVDEICDYVLEHTLPEHGHADDVAIFVVQLQPYPTGPLCLRLPAVRASVPVARHHLRGWLKSNALEIDQSGQHDLEVAWSEACTNAVRHAYGPRDAFFTARATRDVHVVNLEVRDTGQWRPSRGDHGGRGLQLMQMLCDELVIDRGPDGTRVQMRYDLPQSAADAEPGPAAP